MNKTGVHGHRTRFLSIAKAPSYHSSYSPRCDQACRWWSCGTTENVPNKKRIMWTSFFHDDVTTDSSVGRAGDCRMNPISDISRSLVQIRLGGVLFQLDANDFIERKKNILMIVARKFTYHSSYSPRYEQVYPLEWQKKGIVFQLEGQETFTYLFIYALKVGGDVRTKSAPISC